MAIDVVFLQEATPVARWHGPAFSGRVQHQDWGDSARVREGTLNPILVAGYSGGGLLVRAGFPAGRMLHPPSTYSPSTLRPLLKGGLATRALANR